MITSVIIILCGALLLLAYLRLRKMQHSLSMLRSQLDTLQTQADQQRRNAESRLMEQDQIISRLQKENNIIESIRQSLEQQLAQTQQTITEKDTHIQSMQVQLSERERQIEKQRQHLSQDSEAKLILQQQINSLKAEIDKLKLSKPTPRCVMQIEGNLITTETAAAEDQNSPVLTTHFSQEIDPIRTEGPNYPYILTEEDQRTVRPPHAVQNAPSDIGTCLLRERLRESLRPYPEIQLLESVALPVAGKTYSFLPGITLYIEPCHLYIAIEIDTPYNLATRRPTHYAGKSDLLRNLYFIESGWAICHFAERQVIEQPEAIVAKIHQYIAQFTRNEELLIETEPLATYPRWSYTEAQVMEQQQERERYLQAAQIELADITADPYEGDRPTIDILPDRTASLAQLLMQVEGHPYTKISVRTHNNEYLFETGTQQNDTKDYERGWRIYDLVEKKEVFIPHSDIVEIAPLDNLWLHPTYTPTGDAAGEKQLNNLIFEASFGMYPISMTYRNNEGEVHDREVLYIANWIMNNKTGYKFTYDQAIKVKYHQKFLDTNWSYFSGYCNLRKESRIFATSNIQRIALFNCHKSCHTFGITDLWHCLTQGYPNLARMLYDSFVRTKRQKPPYVCAYAHALVLSGKTEEALPLYQSFPKEYRPYPTIDITWEQAVVSDIHELMAESHSEERFKPILATLKEAGWSIEPIETINTDS